jgi:NAD-dependent deacetylase
VDSARRIVIGPETRLLVLTGAGISAESGIPTFRAAGGLWEQEPVEAVASPGGFHRDPARVWRFYSERRANVAQASPNPGHVALAALEQRMGERFLLVTQNVDGLHALAGSRRVVEVHGSLWRRRCSRCAAPAEADRTWPVAIPLPTCDRCARPGDAALLRPDVIWFGEPLDPLVMGRVDQFMLESTISEGPFAFLAVGTSGNVWPASSYADKSRSMGATTWLVNLEPAFNADAFDHVLLGRSGEILPGLFDVL